MVIATDEVSGVSFVLTDILFHDRQDTELMTHTPTETVLSSLKVFFCSFGLHNMQQ